MKISVCMIVKNESSCLRKCLDTVKDADEIIIVDTGSQDNTIEIAKEYTENVYSFAWIDDFSAARNEALKYATGDWILSIDADEVLESCGINKIKEELKGYKGDGLSINLIGEGGGARTRAPRVFLRGLKWLGPIHEIPNCSMILKNSDVSILFGTSEAHKLDPDLDLRILEREYLKNKNNARACFYYGRELFYYKKYKESIEILEHYRTITVYREELAAAYYILSLSYCNLQEWEIARQRAIFAILINPHFKAAIELLASMCFDREKERWLEFAKNADNSNLLFIY